MDSLRKILSNTIVVMILAVLAAASIIMAVFINIDANKAAVSETPVTVASSETPASEQASENIDYKQIQENTLSDLLNTLSVFSNQKNAITSIIDRYIELRYNYTGAPDKDYILSELTSITRKAFLGTVDNSLNYLEGDSEALVVKRYAIGGVSGISMYESSLDTIIYIVNINGEYKVMEYTVFNESGKWMIYAEKELGTVENGSIQTRELQIPRNTEGGQ